MLEINGKMVFRGRVVNIIDMSGSLSKLAEDGQWHENCTLFPLTEELLRAEHVKEVEEQIAGRTVAAFKPEGAGIQLILDDNTRLVIGYSPEGAVSVKLLGSNGNRVL
jgi:hypothetical protein